MTSNIYRLLHIAYNIYDRWNSGMARSTGPGAPGWPSLPNRVRLVYPTGPVAMPVDVPVAVPVDVPVAVPVAAPVAVPVNVPVDVPVDVPVAVPDSLTTGNQLYHSPSTGNQSYHSPSTSNQ